jgi:hypothetical protein
LGYADLLGVLSALSLWSALVLKEDLDWMKSKKIQIRTSTMIRFFSGGETWYFFLRGAVFFFWILA